MELKDLVKGKTYHWNNGEDWIVEFNGISDDGILQINSLSTTNFWNHKSNKVWGSSLYVKNIREVTNLEQQWLNACILANKFIPQDQIPNNELLIQNLIIW